MSELVAVVAVVMSVMVLATWLAAWVAMGRLRRSNRVSPDVDTGAPLRWLAWPMPIAQLHRRLRAAVVLARTARPPQPAPRRRRRRAEEESPLATIAAQLEHHAVAVDRDLVLAARLRGPSRYRVLAPATRQVAEIERLAARVASMARTGGTGPLAPEPLPAALARLSEELVALEAAHAEIARIEAQATGQWPAELAAAPPPAPAWVPPTGARPSAHRSRR